ncbi:MAG: hypothetical protein K9G02_01715 [Microbacteriaceae bacterium]|nr:hypothetical protein [Microbacteriaceae bacterium]
MRNEDDVQAALEETRTVLSWIHEQLVASNLPLEQLGEYIAPSLVLGLPRRGRFVKIGEVWRLGVFLVGKEGTLFRAGETVRSESVQIASHNSAYKAERSEYAYAAFRAGYKPGTVVNFGASRINIDVESFASGTGPLFVRGRSTFVRWRRGIADDEAVLFKENMIERLGLLVNPPAGSTD